MLRIPTRGVLPLLAAVVLAPAAALWAAPARGTDDHAKPIHTVSPEAVEAQLAKPLNLWEAVNAGDVGRVERLIPRTGDLNAWDFLGYPPLSWLAPPHGKEIAKLLLDAGADPNRLSSEGDSPLAYAARDGQLAVVHELIGHGADPNASANQGVPPLFFAAGNNHLAIVNVLLLHGADPDQRVPPGNMPIDNAAQSDSLDTLKRFELLRGKHPAMTSDDRLLGYAAYNGATDAAKYLMSRGATPTGDTVSKASAQGHLATAMVLAQAIGGPGKAVMEPKDNVLDLAVRERRPDAVHRALALGFHAVVGDGTLSDALLTGQVALADELLKAGAEVPTYKRADLFKKLLQNGRGASLTALRPLLRKWNKVKLTEEYRQGDRLFQAVWDLDPKRTPRQVLHDGPVASRETIDQAATLAAWRGKLTLAHWLHRGPFDGPLVRSSKARGANEQMFSYVTRGHPTAAKIAELVKAGADLNAPFQHPANPDEEPDPSYYDDQTPLQVAMDRPTATAARLVAALLENGARPKNESDADSMLDTAAMDKPKLLPVLLDHGVKPSTDCMAVYNTALNGKADELRILLKAGAGPNFHDGSPVCVAAHRADLTCLKLLLDAGGDPSVPDDGRLALHEACAHGRADMVKLLLDHGADPNQRDDLGYSALAWAVGCRHPKIADTIRRAGGRPVKLPGPSPLFVPNSQNDLRRFEALLDHGADPDGSLNINPLSAIHFPNIHSAWGKAHNRVHVHAAGLLLDHGAHPAKAPRFIQALAGADAPGTTELLDRALSAGGDPDVSTDTPFGPSSTPLMIAVIRDRLDKVRVLLAHGADPALEVGGHNSSIKLARHQHKDKIVKLLLAARDKNSRAGHTTFKRKSPTPKAPRP